MKINYAYAFTQIPKTRNGEGNLKPLPRLNTYICATYSYAAVGFTSSSMRASV